MALLGMSRHVTAADVLVGRCSSPLTRGRGLARGEVVIAFDRELAKVAGAALDDDVYRMAWYDPVARGFFLKRGDERVPGEWL
jgi:hypothetical protein